MKDLPAIKSFLSEPRKILITTHSNPDADALGSSLGLKLYLDGQGHNATVITPTDYPDFLKWMPGNDTVQVFDPSNPAPAKSLIESSEVVFCLDFSELKRIDDLGGLIETSDTPKVIIDHHENPADFSKWMIHSTKAAATAELIFDIIEEQNGLDEITTDIANCLYAGLMTDTGSFRHSNVTGKVFSTASKLVLCGANPSDVARLIYDNNSLDRLKFLGYALWDLLKVDMANRVAFFTISAADAERFNLQSGDTEGLVNYALSIKGIKAAALFKEQNQVVKISFRSIKEVAVNNFAQKFFDGGGHKNAAGGISKESLENTVVKFQKLIENGELV